MVGIGLVHISFQLLGTVTGGAVWQAIQRSALVRLTSDGRHVTGEYIN
jgi:hypothetical protein